VFAVYLFVSTELFPFLDHSYGVTFGRAHGRPAIVPRRHVGPFSTTGVLIYLAWVLVASGALLWPFRRRLLASLGCAVTLVALVAGKWIVAAPRIPLLLVLVVLALPAVLAPTTEFLRRHGAISVVGAVALVGVLWYSSSGSIRSLAVHGTRLRGGWFNLYGQTVYHLGDVTLFVGITVLVATCSLIAVRRTVAAGALSLLAVPWLIIARTWHVQSGNDIAGTAVVLGLPLLWLVARWLVDLVHPPSIPTGQAQPA
jgi:hypothetical protein